MSDTPVHTTPVHFQAAVTHRGTRPADYNHYVLYTTYPAGPTDIKYAQTTLGFPPAGYGAPHLAKTTRLPDGRYETVWVSSASCE